MGTYDWMELQTLTSEIAASRSRLAAARSSGDRGRARALEEEIAAAEGRRDRLLAHITTNLVSAPVERAGRGKGKADAEARKAAAAVEAATAEAVAAAEAAGEQPAPDEVDEEQPPLEVVEPPPLEAAEPPPLDVAEEPAIEVVEPEPLEVVEQQAPEVAEQSAATAAAPPASAPKAGPVEGGISMWNQLTPNDIERAKTDLVARRAEMLTRHAEELKALDADQSQLETLEQAIAAFAAKFSGPAGKGGVVELGAERELRQQGGG